MWWPVSIKSRGATQTLRTELFSILSVDQSGIEYVFSIRVEIAPVCPCAPLIGRDALFRQKHPLGGVVWYHNPKAYLFERRQKNPVKQIDSDIVDLELLFVLILIAFSSWILYGSLTFSDRGRIFPYYTSIIVIIGCVLILTVKIFPENKLLQYVIPPKETEETLVTEYDESENGTENKRAQAHISILFGVYLVGCVVLGFLLSSFLFTFAVQTYYQYGSTKFRILFSVFISVFVLVAYQLLRIPLDQGMIFG